MLRLPLASPLVPLLLLAACGDSHGDPTATGSTGSTSGPTSGDPTSGDPTSGDPTRASSSTTGLPTEATTESTATSMSGTTGTSPGCGDGPWSTYGRDGRRTAASDGCIAGALTTLWAYTPAPPEGKDVQMLWHAVADADAVYLYWSATIPPYIGTTAADRVDLNGARAWTFDSGTDANFGDWPSLWQDRLVLQGDAIFMLDVATGMNVVGTGVDWWGQSIPGDGALFASNTSKADGPGLFVYAMDAQATVLWKQNEQGTQCGEALADQTGGIALDGTTLFYAPRYATGSMVQPSFSSGVFAFDTAAMGAKLWEVATTPQSAISAGDGLVFLVEQGQDNATALAARRQSDGSLAWSTPVQGPGAQAPALSGGLVIVGSSGGLLAFDAASGAPKWSAMTPTGYSAPALLTVGNGCAGTQPLGNLPDTAIAIAAGSQTVVAVQGQQIGVLGLADGVMAATTTPDGVTGTLFNPVIVGSRLYVVERNFPASGSRLIALQSP